MTHGTHGFEDNTPKTVDILKEFSQDSQYPKSNNNYLRSRILTVKS